LLKLLQSIVGVNPYAIHHNAQVWGADHDDFQPERWLVEEDSKRKLDRAFFAVRFFPVSASNLLTC
jgi:cytochrome P450